MATTIKEIMSTNPVCCELEMSLETVARMMCDNDCGEIPVVESLVRPRPLGVVTDRDIVCRAVAQKKNPLELTAQDVMSKPVFTVTPDTSIDECIALLEEKRIRRVPVVDDNGYICGMVSQADIAIKAGPDKVGEVVREVSLAR